MQPLLEQGFRARQRGVTRDNERGGLLWGSFASGVGSCVWKKRTDSLVSLEIEKFVVEIYSEQTIVPFAFDLLFTQSLRSFQETQPPRIEKHDDTNDIVAHTKEHQKTPILFFRLERNGKDTTHQYSYKLIQITKLTVFILSTRRSSYLHLIVVHHILTTPPLSS